MPIRQDKSEPPAVSCSAAGYVFLLLASISALLRNWYGAVGLVVGGVALLLVGRGRVYRPAVTRGPDGITCRYNPAREGSTYLLLIAMPGMLLYMLGQPTRWLRLIAVAGFALVAVGVLISVREWRRCLLRITPSSLTVAVPAHRYALTEIPRERILSITGGTGARRNGDTGPVTQIAYLPMDSSPGVASTVLIGPTNTNKAMWVTVEQADLLAALQAWQGGDARDPALLDRVEALLRGGAANPGLHGSAALPEKNPIPAPAGHAPIRVDQPSTPPGYPPAHVAPTTPAPPVAQPSRWRWLRFAAVGIAALIGAAAVPAYQSAHRSSDAPPAMSNAPQAGIADCDHMAALPKNASDEPTVRLPLNPGWTEQAATPGSAEDTPNLRGLYSNPSIRDNDLTPVVQVDLVRTNSTDSLSAIADDVFNKARTMMTVSNENTDMVCGSAVYRADTSGYNPDGKGDRTGTSLLTVVDGKAGTRWVVIASIKTRNPDQREYLSQREALIRGFHAGL